jgi:hypothetical protein
VAEGAALEMLCAGNCTAGSNPALSANHPRSNPPRTPKPQQNKTFKVCSRVFSSHFRKPLCPWNTRRFPPFPTFCPLIRPLIGPIGFSRRGSVGQKEETHRQMPMGLGIGATNRCQSSRASIAFCPSVRSYGA